MFRTDDHRLVLSASDLTSFLACGHLIEQKRALALGERRAWRKVLDPHGELTRSRGERHEREQLERLAGELGGHVDLTPGETRFTRDWLEAQAARTAEAMRAGAPLIYQALLFDGRWQGRVDFLRRIQLESDLGGHAYEVLDTKLARQVKPHVVHQLALYTRLLGAVQGVEPPAAYLILGDGSERPVELGRYGALHRHATRRLERLVEAGPAGTYPEPAAHCAICDLEPECRARRRADDHLSLVAGARRDQRDRLAGLGITRVHDLAAAPADLPVGRLGAERFDLLRHQAALQVRTWADGGTHHRHLPPVADRGYARLPRPDAGDVFFDLEGDPYIGDGGIEYLWGWSTADGAYRCLWAHDAEGEKAALEAFVDFVTERRREHPRMHVFHYAPHEASKLRSLALQYATREEQVDVLLAEDVLVDLYAVVRQGLQVGEESYGLKRLERHTGFERTETTVREGGGSIVAYETWLETGEGDLLDAIRAYNADDCRSTRRLRDWLLDPMRPEAARELGCDFDALTADPPERHAPPDWAAALEALAGELLAGLAADAAADGPDEAERRLLAHLLLFHRREDKPGWWRFFALCDMSSEQLIDERDALGGLTLDTTRPPVRVDEKHTDWTFTFPPQEYKLDEDRLCEAATGAGVNVRSLGDERVVLRYPSDHGEPSPGGLIDDPWIRTDALRGALAALAAAVRDGGGLGAAARTIARRERPRLRSGRSFAQTGDPSLAEMTETALDLDGSHLVVQGPPGTGKTWRGARMVVAALDAGRRVAVTAPSHAAIHNFLLEIEQAAREAGVEFSGVYKGAGYSSPSGRIKTVKGNQAADRDYDLVAGTAWLLAREEHRGRFGLVFVDEAGQYSLANAMAVSLCAGGAVLLGDPQQLPQVTQAQHPGTSGASVLGHLLGGLSTIPADRGFFLTESWRMHPDVCAFVSERSYDARLRSRPACAARAIAAPGPFSGAGLRVLPVPHEGRSQHSVEEAEAIAAACRRLLDGGTVTDDEGRTRRLTARDLMVVAPYNMAVRCIGDRVPAGVQVGTVDRFQGQQAPVVFFAMTCSSGEEVPRGLDFLFSRNRFNVAVSRAQCLAILVHSPALLDADCRTLEAMELVDGVCRFVEVASEQAALGPVR